MHHSNERIPAFFKNKSFELRIHVPMQAKAHSSANTMDYTSEINTASLESDFTDEWFFLNYTARPVTIVQRSGLTVTLRPTVSSYSRDFHVRRILRFRQFSMDSAVMAAKRLGFTNSAELAQLVERLENVARLKLREAAIVIEYTITDKMLEENAKTIYHYETDLVISNKELNQVEQHPYSPDFDNIGAFGQLHDYLNQGKDFNLKIRLCENSATPKSKYINLLGRVYCIKATSNGPAKSFVLPNIPGKPKKVFENKDYLQIFYTASSDAEANYAPGVCSITISLEQARANSIVFDTYEEALASGDVKSKNAKELTEALHQLELLKAQANLDALRRKDEATRQEHELDQIRRAHELELQRLKAELLERQMRQAALEEELSRKDYQRKSDEHDRKAQESYADSARKRQDEEFRRMKEEHDERMRQAREEARRKDEREERLFNDEMLSRQETRKTMMDLLKIIPAALIAVGGILAAWSKYKAQTQTATPATKPG